MKQKTENPPPLTFSIGVMLPPAAPGEMSRLYPAGTASPWHRLEDVPPHLREHIGTPSQPNYNVENFRAETRMIQESLEPENAAVRAALQNIDNEIYETAKARTETVIHNPAPKGTYD
jgi:hypothetical protein